jgi:hypothetical protein
MVLSKNLFGGSFVTNLAIGVGAAILMPLVIPLVARIVKPAAKSAVKGGILISEMVAGRHETTGNGTGPKTDAGKGGQRGVAAKASKAKQGIARPLAKKMVKGGIVVYEKGKQVLSEAEDSVRELVAEAKAEMAQTPGSSPEGNPPGAIDESVLVAGSANPSAPKKAVRKAPGASLRKSASGRSRIGKKGTTKPRGGGR